MGLKGRRTPPKCGVVPKSVLRRNQMEHEMAICPWNVEKPIRTAYENKFWNWHRKGGKSHAHIVVQRLWNLRSHAPVYARHMLAHKWPTAERNQTHTNMIIILKSVPKSMTSQCTIHALNNYAKWWNPMPRWRSKQIQNHKQLSK